MSQTKCYGLMHEDILVAEIYIGDNYRINKCEINKNPYCMKHLPLGVKDKSTLVKWVETRGIANTRDFIKEDLAKIGVRSTFELMLNNLGISLVDKYWLKPINSDITWSLIDDEYMLIPSSNNVDLSVDMPRKFNMHHLSPNATLKGNLRKKWIMDIDGGIFLIKEGVRQSISEVFATILHDKQHIFPFIPYQLNRLLPDGRIGCLCENVFSPEMELVHAYDVINSYSKPNNVSYFEFFIQLCEMNGLYVREMLEYQIMTDFIISNVDRHLNNFGILRNSKTLEWIGMAPIFDCGNSMFFDMDTPPSGRDLLKMEVSSFVKKEVNLLKYVNNVGLVDVNKLPSNEELYRLLSVDESLSENTKEKIIYAYNLKIKYFEDFQSGDDIWNIR